MWASRTTSRTPSTGRPIGGLSGQVAGEPVSGYQLARWVSDGPYMFTSRTAG